MSKPKRDITLGEMQDECKFRGRDCTTLGGGMCDYYDVCDQMRSKNKLPPAEWDLNDPPRFSDEAMAFFRGWYAIGAKCASRDSDDVFCHEITFYDEATNLIGYMVHTKTANEFKPQQRIDLAELLVEDGAK